MTDDDRRLAERLTRYESRVPVDAPAAVTAPPSRGAWPLIGGLAAVVVLAVVVATNLVSDRPEVGVASPNPSPSDPSSPELSAEMLSQPATPNPTTQPTATATVDPTPGLPGRIVRWNTAAAFVEDGFALEVTDVTWGAGQFIALGLREPLDERGQVGPSTSTQVMWTSADGATWTQVPLGPEFDGAHLSSLVTLPDGAAAVYGVVDHAASIDDWQPGPPFAWKSLDGVTWEPMELSMPTDTRTREPLGPGNVQAGARGYLSLHEVPEGEFEYSWEIWYSADGVTWEITHRVEEAQPGWLTSIRDAGAGDGGFVIVGERFEVNAEERVYEPFIHASGDGRNWVVADPSDIPAGHTLLVEPVGGDWIVTQTNYDGRPDGTWFSHDGLHWVERQQLDVPDPDLPEGWEPGYAVIGRIVGAGDRVFASGATVVCCHAPWFAAGIWSSADATSWERLGFPDDAVITAAAVVDDVTVLVGYTGASPDTEWQARATMWVSERE
jgi:hypothetical protein